MNDSIKNKLESKMYPRLDFFFKINSEIKLMDSGKRGERIRSLTGDTANAIYRDLHAMVYITKKLFVGFDYVPLRKKCSPIVWRDSLIFTTLRLVVIILSHEGRSSIV